MIYGIARDGVIINAIEAESIEIAQAAAGGAEVIAGAGIGWVLTDGEWVPPVPVVIKRPLSGLEFEIFVQQIAGLTDAEVLTAYDDNNLRLFWARLNRANVIEHDNPLVLSGLAALVATGHLSEAQKEAVLAAWPVQ